MSNNRPKAEVKIRQADIVFCIDSTGSMQPCFDGVKNHLSTFIDGLHSAGNVDFRLKLIAYRDKHDPSCGVPWEYLDFTNSIQLFKDKLSKLEANGGGEGIEGIVESTLDALYEAIKKSDWREHDTHKIIVLFTDAGSHPTMHPSTFPFPVNDVNALVQQLQTFQGSILFMVAPDCEIYRKIEQGQQDAERKRIFYALKKHDLYECLHEDEQGFKNVDFADLMTLIGQTISQSIRQQKK
jgi:Mg-chelatase subunit ChlD